MIVALMLLGVLVGVAGGAVVAGAFWTYSKDLPTVETLGSYTPPTVTVVYDRHGELMGEIYEKRRYVVDFEDVPKHVQDAFIAAEDANFWTHGGVDYEGILRAIGRNVSKGRKAQGASTITMQVARNFLLTRAKTYERKIREVILSWRIEETFSKEHVLYLYLNEIYLGSGAYGVEAAARTYFNKHVQDLTVAEAAILAGLPQRPSDYSPHRHWDKARSRQEYVLGQMKAKGYLDEVGYQAALEEVVEIHTQENEFLQQAPYFTEHVRRYLVETYGFEKIYNDGLSVYATTDLELQKVARKSVADGVLTADNRVGWRGPVEKIDVDAIQARLEEQEKALREEASKRVLRVAAADNGGGYGTLPTMSPLEVQRVYDSVVTEVTKKHAIVAVGAHRIIIPVSWTSWGYEPNPKRSWRYRSQKNMTAVLARGDVIQVRVEGLDSQEFKNLRGYPAAKGLPAAKIYQTPELEGALFSYRLSDGAVLSMVGGYDFEGSEYNRATQARRQVGSTFKPIVYAAAIGTRKFTGGTLVQDAPLVFQTLGDKTWKPGNYGEEYEGNITLRRALQLSKNVCTVRVLDRIGLDPVFDLAGPTLRIGYNTPTCSRRHIKSGSACEGDRTPSAVDGMEWCSYCDPASCPLVRSGQQKIRKNGADIPVGEVMACLDEPRDINGEPWCHSCDVNLRACDWLPIERIPDTDPCVDARQDGEGRIWCRTCDLSMGLGSSSLTMVELARAYSAFATYGQLVEPHFIEKVVDRDGTIIETYEGPDGEWPRVMEPGVASIAHWLLREVATGGTGARTNRLGIQVAGKTGTTNDFFDAWFVGYNPDIITAAWVGFDQPHSMGVSFTGGKTALPIWMDFMRAAVPKDGAPRFKALQGVEMVPIDERSGRVAIGGRSIPMLPGTAPTNVVGEVGQKSGEDLLIDDF
jgi:penicillin-binding protein 1A